MTTPKDLTAAELDDAETLLDSPWDGRGGRPTASEGVTLLLSYLPALLRMARRCLDDRPYAKVIAPTRNREGDLCMLCDGTRKHEHPEVQCSRCGKTGLQENWPFNCCID